MYRQTLPILLSLVLFATALPGPTTPVRAMADPPEEAVRQTVEASGAAYAGACAATRSPEDIGKVCSTFIAERGDTRAYLTGRTFSEYSAWVFVRGGSPGWRAVGTAPLDFFALETVIPWPE